MFQFRFAESTARVILEGRRKIMDIDKIVSAQRHCALDTVFQFAHITRPLIGEHHVHRCLTHVHVFLGRKFVEEVLN